jgi:hypothetical protein
MNPEPGIATVGHAIQLSVGPVFLLSGIAGMLAVMTSRLARVVDRARAVEAKLERGDAGDFGHFHAQLATYSRRAKLINRAITFCTVTALLICSVVATMFVGAFLEFDASLTVAILFVSAMTSLFTGLLFFLREIFLATAALRIGPK